MCSIIASTRASGSRSSPRAFPSSGPRLRCRSSCPAPSSGASPPARTGRSSLGERLGPLFATYWLRASGTVPEGAHLILDFGGEATLWVDGQPAESLSSGPRQARLSVPVPSGERSFELELACNDPFGFGESGQGLAPRFVLRRCELARFDADAWRSSTTWRSCCALEDVAEPDVGGRAAERAARVHARRRPRAAASLLARDSRRPCSTSAIGHAHLDTAWLWPLEETWRKLVRTTTAQLRLLDDYPAYVFAHSQAQHYAWLRDRAPALFARVRAAIDAGALDPRRRHLDRAGLQPAVGRVAGAPVPLRPALLRARARPPLHGVLEPGRLRLHRPAPAADARGRDHALPDAEALVEPLQRARAPHLHRGRGSTARRC